GRRGKDPPRGPRSVELPRRRRGVAVQTGADAAAEGVPEDAHRLRAEGVAAEAGDLAVLLVEAEDLLEGLPSPSRHEPGEDALARVRPHLRARRVVLHLRGPLIVALDDAAEELEV